MDTLDSNEHNVDYLTQGYLIAGRYEIVQLLGSGGMGAVYLAQDRILGGEEIAIKILHRQYAYEQRYTQRFLREVQLMRRVNHANVVRTYDVGADQDIVYFTMEFVPGKSLLDLIEARAIRIQDVAEITKQICGGLAAIHDAGIIHRDLKPGNIILLTDGTIKITDFGVARPEISELTAHNEVIGSSSYMAPEIWLGEDVTFKVDLYSLGVILYELTVGELPFDSDSPASLMRMHLDKQPTPLDRKDRSVPAWLNRLVLMLLEKKASRRIDSAQEVIRYIDSSVATSNGLTPEAQGASAEFIKHLEEISKRASDVNATRIQRRDTKSMDRSLFSWKFKTPFRQKSVFQIDSKAVISVEAINDGFLRLMAMAAMLFLLLVPLVGLTALFDLSQPLLDESALGPSMLVPKTPDSWGVLAFYGLIHCVLSVIFFSLPLLVMSAASLRISCISRTLVACASYFCLMGLIFYLIHLFPVLKYNYFDKTSIVHASLAVQTQLAELAYLSPFFTNWNSFVLKEGLKIDFESAKLITFSSSIFWFAVVCSYICLCTYVARITVGRFANKSHYTYAFVGLGLLFVLLYQTFYGHVFALERYSMVSHFFISTYDVELPASFPLPFAYNWLFVFFTALIIIPFVGGRKIGKIAADED